jgi:peptide deformylase
MSVREICLLGNPVLRERSMAVKDVSAPEVQETLADLRDTLADFRSRRGFGRGIAAPQIGIARQIIYIHFDQFTGALINPRITRQSRTKLRLWDDCFSFPDLLVYVERSLSVEVTYLDEQGKRRKIAAHGDFSELLQHESDHLNGILAIDRAVDSKHIILRSELGKIIQTTGAPL